MGTDNLEARFSERLAAKTERIERRVVLGDIELIARLQGSDRLGWIQFLESCSRKHFFHGCHGQIVDRRSIKEFKEIVDHRYYCLTVTSSLLNGNIKPLLRSC